MKLNTRSRYGVRLLLDIALHSRNTHMPIKLPFIAQRLGISADYLELIARELKRSGYVVGYRGANGGYRLARAPKDITVGAIVALMEGPITLNCITHPDTCKMSSHCPTQPMWKAAFAAIRERLDQITFEQLLVSGKDPLLYSHCR